MNIMNINNLKACISHDEAMIDSFIRNPDFADYYLRAVKADGDNDEIRDVQAWYDEAKSRSSGLGYWENIIDNAKTAVRNGYNLDTITAYVSQALAILKSAMPVHA